MTYVYKTCARVQYYSQCLVAISKRTAQWWKAYKAHRFAQECTTLATAVEKVLCPPLPPSIAATSPLSHQYRHSMPSLPPLTVLMFLTELALTVRMFLTEVRSYCPDSSY
jgi:hypothetical protein